LRENDFPIPNDAALYKYVPSSTWEYMKAGSFRLGSAKYYRRAENPNIRDDLEGAGHFFLQSSDKQVSFSLVCGFNCAIFCGTYELNGPDHDLMLSRFGGIGGKVLKIEPLGEFIATLKRQTRAFRARVLDVIYTDAKAFLTESDDVTRIWEILGIGGQKNGSLRQLNREFFDELYEVGFMPSLLAKPTSFKEEKERRIIFETRSDLRQQAVTVSDRALLEFITVVDG
jgi:hypothetical protein